MEPQTEPATKKFWGIYRNPHGETCYGNKTVALVTDVIGWCAFAAIILGLVGGVAR